MTKTDKNNLDVDNRSDTTRQASEGTIPWGASLWAGNNPFTEILSIINDKTRTTNNPNILTGEPIFLPGFGGAKLILLANKLMETINNFWKNLGKTKIRVQGAKTSGILTLPGTAPTTFNGQNILYISSPNGLPVTHKFYTDLGSEYILTKDGFARRVKSPHTNTKGTDAGLHDWNQGKTYFLDDKGDFSGQFRLLKEKYPNVAVATGKDGKMYFLNTDTNKLILTEDLFPRAVNQGILLKGYYGIPYSYEPKLGYSLFEFGTNGTNGTINWYHPGSQVAFIEGLKQGGKMNLIDFLKKGSGIHIKKENRGKFTDYCGGKVTSTCIAKGKNSSNPAIRKRATFAANARKWKHRSGGVLLLLIFALEGTKLNFFLKAGNFLNSELGKNLVSGIMNGVLGIINTNKQLELYNEYLNFLEENYKYEKSKDIAEKYKRALLNKSDLSDIVNANSAYIEANALNDDTEFNLLKLYYLNLIKQNQQQGYYNAFVGLGNSVIGMLNSNKNASPSTTNKA